MAVVLQAYVLSGQERFLWYTDEEMNAFIVSGGSIQTFPTPVDATFYAATHHLPIADDLLQSLSLDRVIEWIEQRDHPDPELLFDAWNFLIEVANSIPERGQGFQAGHRKNIHFYDRLFWGLNLPAVTPEGEHFSPEWSESEKLAMSEHLVSGIDLFTRLSTISANPEPAENSASDVG